MTQPALDFFTRRGVAVKNEVVEGTDIVPTGASNGILMFDGQSGTEFDKFERVRDLPYFSGNPFLVSNERGFIEGDIELFAPAAPGTDVVINDAILAMAGLLSAKVSTVSVELSDTYSPISTAIPSSSAYFWHVDKLKKIIGARANLSQVGMEVGNRFKARARLLGSLASLIEEALPAVITYDSSPSVITYDTTVTNVQVDGGSDILVWAKSLYIDFNSDLRSKEYTSVRVNNISDRKASWSLRIARTALADFDPWAVRRAGSIFTANMAHTDSGTLVSSLGIRGQIDAISEVDIDGDLGWDLSGPCLASTSATAALGDEFYIKFEDTNP